MKQATIQETLWHEGYHAHTRLSPAQTVSDEADQLTLVISPVATAMKFIVDNNVGKLSTWLRALGYDALFLNPIEDRDLVEIAGREERIILTKDTGILRRRVVVSGEVEALKIEGDDWRQQVRQVVRTYGLRREPAFTRCIACNTLLEECTRDQVRAHVPPYVHRTRERFSRCPGCGRHYWQGTHHDRMTRILGDILGEL